MSDDLAERLRGATGAGDCLEVTVVAGEDPTPVHHEFKYPFVVIGRGEGCDILLPNPKVSFRHAYFQVIEGRVFAIDLASRNGLLWPDGPRKYGWVIPGEPVQVGPYILRVVADKARDDTLQDALADLNPLERYRGQAGLMPKVDLEFRYEGANQPTWAVNRLLTLIGRSPVCKLRFDSPMVSAVHCGLLLTRHGLWAIDLMGRGGTKVDGQKVRATPLESGNEVSFGRYEIGIFYEEPFDLASPERLTDNAAESETSMDDLESPFLQDAPVDDTALQSSPESPAKGEGLDWMGTVFKIEGEGNALIIVPLVDGCGFRYQQLHVEANALQRKLDMNLFANLVIDLRHLNYFGSELIGVLVRLARGVTNNKGRAAICRPSPKMLEVLESMKLDKLWPIFASREEALKYVKG